MAIDEAVTEGVVIEAVEGETAAVRSFRVHRFTGFKNGFFKPMAVCLVLLMWITCGCACFCVVPLICCIGCVLLPPYDTLEFNNETRMLVSHAYPPVEYERVRLETVFFPISHTVHVFIFLEGVEPLPFRRGARWMLYSPRMQDPKFELPMRARIGPNADVARLRETVDEISAFTEIPVKHPEESWAQIELRVQSQADAGKSLVEVRPVWDPNEKKSRH